MFKFFHGINCIFWVGSFFQRYASVTSGMIFFEFTTMIILLTAAGASAVIKVTNKFSCIELVTERIDVTHFLIISMNCFSTKLFHDFQPPFSGDVDTIKFNFVVMSAACSMFISSKMGNEVSYTVSIIRCNKCTRFAQITRFTLHNNKWHRLPMYQLMYTQLDGRIGRPTIDDMFMLYWFLCNVRGI